MAVSLGGHAQGIDDGRGIHEQLQAETDEIPQVEVFGGQRGDDQPQRHGVKGQQKDQKGEEQNGEVKMERRAGQQIAYIHYYKYGQLDEHLQQIAGDAGQRDDQAREPHLAEDTGIGREDIRGDGEGIVEIVPEHDAGHVEERLRGTVGGDACQTAEDEHVDDGGEQGLDDVPQGAEDGLLVLGDDVTPHVHAVEVAIAPQGSQFQVEPSAAGGDLKRPVVVHYSRKVAQWHLTEGGSVSCHKGNPHNAPDDGGLCPRNYNSLV